MISFDQLMLRIILVIRSLIICHRYDRIDRSLIGILLAFIKGSIFILLFRTRSTFSLVIIFGFRRLFLADCPINARLRASCLAMVLSLLFFNCITFVIRIL